MAISSQKTDEEKIQLIRSVLPWKSPKDCLPCDILDEEVIVLAIGVYIYDLGKPEMCPSQQTIASVYFSRQRGWCTHITDKPFCVYYWTLAPVKQEGSCIRPY